MDDNKTAVQDASTTGGTQNTSTPAIEVKSSDSTDQNDTVEVSIKSSEDKSQAPNDTTETQKNIQAEAGKIKALEEERNKYSKEASEERKKREELERYERRLETINQTFRKDPDAYERYREAHRQATGEDLGDYQTLYGDSSSTGNLQSFDPSKLEELVDQKVAQKLENERIMSGLEKFVSAHPELEIRGLDESSNDYQERTRKLQAVSAVAGSLRNLYPEWTQEQAFEEALNSLPEYRGKVVEKERRAGELVGKANAYARETGVTSGVAGGASSSSGTTITLTREQKQVYDRILAESGKSTADRFAQKVAQ